jgi:hypothetical protein
MKASNLNLPKPSLHITSSDNAVAAEKGSFIARLRRIGQTLAALACRFFLTGRDTLLRIKNSVPAIMLNTLNAVGNYLSDAFDKTLSRPVLAPSVEPPLFALDKRDREIAEKIIEEFAIPLASEWERKNGMTGSIEKLICRIGIALNRLATSSRNERSVSRAKREAKFLDGQKFPGLAMLMYLYKNRVGEGFFESLLLSQAGNFGERYKTDNQSAQHQQAVHALEILWSIIIAQRPAP